MPSPGDLPVPLTLEEIHQAVTIEEKLRAHNLTGVLGGASCRAR